MSDVWIETDTDREGVDGLEMTVEHLSHVARGDHDRWKWVIFAVHNALTCLMCLAVEGSDKLGAMTDDCRQAWLEAYRAGELGTKRRKLERMKRLASFMKLFDRVQSDQMMRRYVDSQPLQPTEDQTLAVRRLHRWRNDFMHYKPMSLSIEVRGYPEIVRRF
jgi:hypothetical protein